MYHPGIVPNMSLCSKYLLNFRSPPIFITSSVVGLLSAHAANKREVSDRNAYGRQECTTTGRMQENWACENVPYT